MVFELSQSNRVKTPKDHLICDLLQVREETYIESYANCNIVRYPIVQSGIVVRYYQIKSGKGVAKSMKCLIKARNIAYWRNVGGGGGEADP